MLKFSGGFLSGGLLVGLMMTLSAAQSTPVARPQRNALIKLDDYCRDLRARSRNPNDPRGLYDHTDAFTIRCAPPKPLTASKG